MNEVFNNISPTVICKRSKPKPSVVYNTYWKFATERQDIFFRRLRNEEYPWTTDEILLEYKFTNAYRAADRVSQFLIKDVIYNGSQSPEELFFRIILFKLFNKIDTWEILRHELGELTYKEFDYKKYDQILSELLGQNISIYSAAYIMASGSSYYGKKRKHQNHLKLLNHMIRDSLPTKLMESKSMKEGYELLLGYPSIGSFLAYQFITDINYSNLTNYSESEFVKAGPGAIEGISKCFVDKGEYSNEDIIRLVADQQEKEFDKLGLNFTNLFGRELQLIDCQNLFCEVGKYARVMHPDIKGCSTRVRIKQKYKQERNEPIEFFFPPKWNLNY